MERLERRLRQPPRAPWPSYRFPPAPFPWAVPIGHAAGVLVGMRVALSAMWPAAYDPLPVDRSAHRLEAAFRGPARAATRPGAAGVGRRSMDHQRLRARPVRVGDLRTGPPLRRG